MCDTRREREPGGGGAAGAQYPEEGGGQGCGRGCGAARGEGLTRYSVWESIILVAP